MQFSLAFMDPGLQSQPYIQTSKQTTKNPSRGAWCTPAIPALGNWKQEDPKFKDILGYVTSWRQALSQRP